MIRVPQKADNLQYFYEIESATGAKLTPDQIAGRAPAKNAPKTFFTPVGFTLVAQGDYSQLMDVLRRLENGQHYCRVLTCNLRPLTEQRGGALGMTLTLELLGTQ
jgi:hypothetical protein